MHMNRQTRTFAKQVQVDLLALSDADLFWTIHQWLDGEAAEPNQDVPEDIRSALGYTPISIDHLSSSFGTLPANRSDAGKQWLAPAPPRLRELLTEMDMKLFLQYVLPFAFQSLHPKHPEWGEGLTFNAHLANHLRWIATNRQRATKGQAAPQGRSPAR